MITWLRRLVLLALVGGVVYALSCVLRRRRDHTVPAEWPPLDPPSTTAPATTTTPVPDGHQAPPAAAKHAGSAEASGDGAGEPAGAARWVAPDDGRCPPGYPIKAKENSGIYHVPGGRFYDRTLAERCYANTEDAEADGYRAAKT